MKADLARAKALLDEAFLILVRITGNLEKVVLLVQDVETQATVPPPVPATVPAPTPTPTPTTSSLPIVDHVFATCWGNREDENRSDWSEMAYSWAPKPGPGTGKTTLGAALPCKVAKGTVVEVKLSGHAVQWLSVPVIDLGPWNIWDPYWRTRQRPQAETGTDTTGRKTNRAGIDLTPAVWAILTNQTAEECWASSPSGYVDIRVYEPGGATGAAVTALHPLSSLAEKIVQACNDLPEPFPYEPETEGGVLGCANVVSFALREAGAIQSIVLNVDGVTELLRERGWKKVSQPYRCGDVISWLPWEGSNGHKHVGIVEIEREETDVVMVWNNSSSKRAVDYEPLEGDSRPVEMVLRNPEEQ